MRRRVVVRDLGHRFGRTAVVAGGIAVAMATLAPPARAQFFWERPRYSADDIARIAMQHGFHPLARPFRNDDVYLADVVNGRGRRERLVVSAESGQILQRFVLEDGQRYRRYADPSIPRGPIPPGRIPNDDNQPSFFSRLFSGNEDAAPPQAEGNDISVPVQPRAPRARRPRVVEQTPETVRQTPVESAPLAPAAPRVIPPRINHPPSPAAPAEASLPPPAAPAAPAQSDKPVRSISRNPLAIPGTREADAPAANPAPAATARVSAPAVVPPKPAPAVKEAVPVAPLE